MVKRCRWGTCNSDSRYPERLAGGVTFIPFPKPKTKLDQCLRWIRLCGQPRHVLNEEILGDHRRGKHVHVCSKHFIDGLPTKQHPDPVSAVTEDQDTAPKRKEPSDQIHEGLVHTGITAGESGEITPVSVLKNKPRKKSEVKKTPSRRGLQSRPRNATGLGEMIMTYKKPGINRPVLSKRVVKNGFQTNFLSQVTHFWKTKQFCDLRLLIGSIEVLAHQLVFNVARPFCLSSLTVLEGVHPITTMLVPLKVSEEAVKNFLTYLYEGSLFITENTVQEILHLGQFFRMTSIEYFCNAFLVAVQRAAGVESDFVLPEAESHGEFTDLSETLGQVHSKDNCSSKVSENDDSQRRSPVICRKWRQKPRAKSATVSANEANSNLGQLTSASDADWSEWDVKGIKTAGTNIEEGGLIRDMDTDLRVSFQFETQESRGERDAEDEADEIVDQAVEEGVDETPLCHGDDMFEEGDEESRPRIVNVSWSDEENQEWVVNSNESEDNFCEDEDQEEMKGDNQTGQKEDGDPDSSHEGGYLEAVSVSQDQYDFAGINDSDDVEEHEKVSSLSEGKIASTEGESHNRDLHLLIEDVKPVLLADGTILDQSSLHEGKSSASSSNVKFVDSTENLKRNLSVDMETDLADSKVKSSDDHAEDLKIKLADVKTKEEVTEDDHKVEMMKKFESQDGETKFDPDVNIYRHSYMDVGITSGKVEIDHAEDMDSEEEDIKPIILPDGSVYNPDYQLPSTESSEVIENKIVSSPGDDTQIDHSGVDANPVLMFGNGTDSVEVKSETEVFKHDNIYFRYYKCTQCQSLFTSKNRQEEHIQVVHQGLRFVCKFCGKKFTSKCGHRMHEKDHMGQNPYRRYKCGKCQERFATRDELKVHKKQVCREFRCGTCRRVFFSQHYFQKHVSECGKSLQCSKCSRMFKDKFRLSQHLENHLYQEVVESVVKPAGRYRCKICSKEFTGKKNYLKHKTIVHSQKQEEKKEIQCSECRKTFKCLSSMRRHFKSEHPNSELPTQAKMNWRYLRRESPFQQTNMDRSVSDDEVVSEEDSTGPQDIEIDLQDETSKQDETPKLKRSKTKRETKGSDSVTGSKNFHCGECGMEFAYFASLRRHSKSEHPKTSNLAGVC